MPTTTLSEPGPTGRRQRDPRLDFFRGIGLAIILIAHIPFNPWTLWIPARFGFSDATEIFVFLSGMASAAAFGGVFDRSGFQPGIARIALRIWQVYWSHINLFLAVTALLITADAASGGGSHIASLNLQRFIADPGPLLVGLLTLSYVPNYFDILPMYLVILALIPPMLALERLNLAAPLALMALLWGMAQAGVARLPAEPWSERTWFFDPFGWQLIFFLGFFLMRERLPAPPRRPGLVLASLGVLALAAPLSWFRLLDASPGLAAAAEALHPLTDKSSFGILRLVHFAALAYLAFNLAGPGGRRLKGGLVRIVSLVGQQSLAVFIASMMLAQALGLALDQWGRSSLVTLAVNITGLLTITAVAYLMRWLKAQPR